MNNLFDYITNISNNNPLQTIKDSIEEECDKLKEYGIEQLCKVYAANISDNLNSKHIKCTTYNLDENCGIDHEIIIAKFFSNNTEIKTIIDPTFNQFFKKEIKDEFYKELIKNKYFIIEDNNLEKYYNLFITMSSNKNKQKR